MREDLKPGNVFTDFGLPNHVGKMVRLSEYMDGWPTTSSSPAVTIDRKIVVS